MPVCLGIGIAIPLSLPGCAPIDERDTQANPSAVHAPADFEEPLAGTALSFDMVGVAGGQVMMPDGATAEVAPFLVGRHEVTWDLYDVFLLRLDEPENMSDDEDGVTRPSKPYIAMDRSFGHAGYPAISMSARGATHFCEWLSLKTGRPYRLPTEAEWRYLCAEAGIAADAAADHAWFDDNADRKTHPVGTKDADQLGLHDLWGNAAEWCVRGPGDFVALGGCYKDQIAQIGCDAVMIADRSWNESDPQFPKSVWWFADAGWVGFRVVCDPE